MKKLILAVLVVVALFGLSFVQSAVAKPVFKVTSVGALVDPEHGGLGIEVLVTDVSNQEGFCFILGAGMGQRIDEGCLIPYQTATGPLFIRGGFSIKTVGGEITTIFMNLREADGVRWSSEIMIGPDDSDWEGKKDTAFTIHIHQVVVFTEVLKGKNKKGVTPATVEVGLENIVFKDA